MLVMTSNIKLKIGGIYTLVDKDTNGEAKIKVIREATEDEYMNEEEVQIKHPLAHFYMVSTD